MAIAARAAPPVIDYQPRPQQVILYQAAALGVIASGTPPLFYQWSKNGALIPGATNDQLVFPQAQFADAAVYSVTVSNSQGAATSTNAALRIKLPQAGDLDGSFLHAAGVGNVYASAVQPDGRILIGGTFSPVTSDLVHGGVARLKTDGTVDHTFLNGYSGANGTVNALALQGDGKIIIAGSFNQVNGEAHTNIARLNPDGSLDESFESSFDGPNAVVCSVVLQTDGKILVGGAFEIVNGAGATNLTRLNSDGSLDKGFHDPGIGSSPGSAVRAVCVQSNSMILIAGFFDTVGGAARQDVAQLNGDGTLAAVDWPVGQVFSEGGGFLALAPYADGSVLAGGFIQGYGANYMLVMRLYPDGSYTNSHYFAVNLISGETLSLAVQSDGKVLVGGWNILLRLTPDGNFDRDLGPQLSAISGFVDTMAMQADGKMLIAGFITGQREGIARLNLDDTLDSTFQTDRPLLNNGAVWATAVQSDGKSLIGGHFTQAQGFTRNHLVRLNTDGSLDVSFLGNEAGADNDVESFAFQTDGKLLVGGMFSLINGASYHGIARLNSDGTLDATFQSTPVLGPNDLTGDVFSMVRQTDGKVVIAGRFVSLGGAAVTNVARLNADGTRDSNFQAAAWDGTGDGAVNALVLQNDGKSIIGGEFDTVNGQLAGHIARLNPDGSLDTNFQAAVTLWGGSAGAVTALALQPDGKLVLGGLFTEVNGQTNTAVARLNTDGTLDSTFVPLQFPFFSEASVRSLVLQTNGGIIISGSFPTVNGHTNILRLNPDGSLDDNFRTTYGPGLLALQANQQLLVDGTVRLWGSDFPPVLQSLTKTGTTVNLTWYAIPGRSYQVQYTAELAIGDWTNWPGYVVSAGDTASQVLSVPAAETHMFFQILQLP